MTEEEKAVLKKEILREVQRNVTLALWKVQGDIGVKIKERTESGILPSGSDPLADLYMMLALLVDYVRYKW